MNKTTKPSIPKIKFNGPNELYDFFNSNDKKITDYIVKAIEYGIKNSLNELDIFEIQPYYDMSYNMLFYFKKEDWIEALDYCIKKYIEEDNMEACIKIEKIKKKIK